MLGVGYIYLMNNDAMNLTASLLTLNNATAIIVPTTDHFEFNMTDDDVITLIFDFQALDIAAIFTLSIDGRYGIDIH